MSVVLEKSIFKVQIKDFFMSVIVSFLIRIFNYRNNNRTELLDMQFLSIQYFTALENFKNYEGDISVVLSTKYNYFFTNLSFNCLYKFKNPFPQLKYKQ